MGGGGLGTLNFPGFESGKHSARYPVRGINPPQSFYLHRRENKNTKISDMNQLVFEPTIPMLELPNIVNALHTTWPWVAANCFAQNCLKYYSRYIFKHLKVILVSYTWQTSTQIPRSGGRVWCGAGGVDSSMCYRTAVGGSDGESYHYTLTEDIHAFRVTCSAQVQCANDFSVAAICHSPQKLAHACLRYFQHTSYPCSWTGVMWWPNPIFQCGCYKHVSATLIALSCRRRQYIKPQYLWQTNFPHDFTAKIIFQLEYNFYLSISKRKLN